MRCSRCGNTIYRVEDWLKDLATWICRTCTGHGDTAEAERPEKMKVCKNPDCKHNGNPLPLTMFNTMQSICKDCQHKRDTANRLKAKGVKLGRPPKQHTERMA